VATRSATSSPSPALQCSRSESSLTSVAAEMGGDKDYWVCEGHPLDDFQTGAHGAPIIITDAPMPQPALPAKISGSDASCYLEDGGTTYINGPCKLRWIGHDGSFFINDGKFEGMASHDNTGAMVGAWYSLDDKSPLRRTFDALHRKGACWSNSTQRICAGKPGEGVAPVGD